MKTFITSDSHFGHKNIIHYAQRKKDGKLFESPYEMDEELIRIWNEIIGKNDQVFHLGDFGFGSKRRMKEIVGRLNGEKTLILGNHDTQSAARWIELGFKDVLQWKVYGGWVLCHYPYGQDARDEKILESNREERKALRCTRLADSGQILLHGHTHSHEKISYSKNGTLQVHVGVDAWGYKPIDERDIRKLIEEETRGRRK